MTYLLPKGFQEDPDRRAVSEHGGFAWRDGRRRFQQSDGFWGVTSFEAEYSGAPYSSCRINVGGSEVFVATRIYGSRYEAYAWPGGATAMIASGTNPDDQRLFLAVFRTLSFR
jgi:hypothetical protein